MIKFIIVDDNYNYLKIIEDMIVKLMFKSTMEYKIEKYSTLTEDLQKSIDDCSVQKIFVLDIELDKKASGIDIAREIRKNDWDSELIFITNHDKMFETVYRSIFKVFDFIEKFVSFENRLEKDLSLIIDQKADFGQFVYKNNKLSVQIYFKDITYIYRETCERKLVIKTTHNNFLVSMTIPEIMTKLDSRFKQVHRACIVNKDRANVMNWGSHFILDTDEKVDMCSKSFKDSFYD